MENLKATLNKIKNRNKHIITCGDFNYDLLKYEYNEYINEFLNKMSSIFLQSCVTNRPSFGNIIDKITGHFPNSYYQKHEK